MLRQRDVLRTDVRTGELRLTAPDTVLALDDLEALAFLLRALPLVHREAVGLVDRRGTEVVVVAGGDVTRGHTGATPDTPRRGLDLLAVGAGL